MEKSSEDQFYTQDGLDWLKQRTRPTNWYDIEPDDDIHEGVLGSFRTLVHMFQISFGPEIRRRLEAGRLTEPVNLFALQQLQEPDQPPIVRINGEVRGVPLIKVDRPIEAGGQVLLSDLKNLVSFDVEVSEIDCGHFTAFWTGDSWVYAFDFRNGRGKAAEHLKCALEFLDTAEAAAKLGNIRPSIDNLFSASELVAKARLILHSQKTARTKSHGTVKSELNRWGKLGNVDGDFVRVYNKYYGLRNPARYDPTVAVACPEDEEFRQVRSEIEDLMKAVAHRDASNLH